MSVKVRTAATARSQAQPPHSREAARPEAQRASPPHDSPQRTAHSSAAPALVEGVSEGGHSHASEGGRSLEEASDSLREDDEVRSAFPLHAAAPPSTRCTAWHPPRALAFAGCLPAQPVAMAQRSSCGRHHVWQLLLAVLALSKMDVGGTAMPLINWSGGPRPSFSVTLHFDLQFKAVTLASGGKVTATADKKTFTFALAETVDALIFRGGMGA